MRKRVVDKKGFKRKHGGGLNWGVHCRLSVMFSTRHLDFARSSDFIPID